eukprot:2877700-Alexandrium_andersonii.AAC.1
MGIARLEAGPSVSSKGLTRALCDANARATSHVVALFLHCVAKSACSCQAQVHMCNHAGCFP